MNATLRRWRHRAAHRAVTALSTRPRLYYGARRLTGTYDHLCVRPETEIVIEGYPRSANSTTVHGFLARQERPVRVAHHKHHAAQVLQAVRWGVPAVALIRPPRAAILSSLALAEEARRRHGGPGGRDSHVTFGDAAGAWLAFYRAILPLRDALVIAPFARVTADLAAVIDEVNARFATRFESAPEVRTPQPDLGWHARSNPLRREILAELDTFMHAAEREWPRLGRLLAACDALHDRLVASP